MILLGRAMAEEDSVVGCVVVWLLGQQNPSEEG
jgi:hypothetical protein